MKAYTSLEQSKKLAEILPLGSADMCWQYQKDRWVGEPDYKEFPQFEHATDKRDIPCWSLAALLGVLKYPSLTQDVENKWSIMDWTGAYPKNEYSFDNPIDACYEMILKLNKLNLL